MRRSPLVPLAAILGFLALSLAGVLIAGATSNRSFAFVSPWDEMMDYAVLYEASHARATLDPYSDNRNVFTPLATQLNLSLANFELTRARHIFYWINIACLILACVLAVRRFLPEPRQFWPSLLTTLAIASISYPVMFLLDRGNIDGVLTLFIAISLYLSRGGTIEALSGVALALCAGLRLPFVILAVAPLIQRRWRVLLGAIAAIVLIWLMSLSHWAAWFDGRFFEAWNYWRTDENAGLAAVFHFFAEAIRLYAFEPHILYAAGAWALGASFVFMFVLLDLCDPPKDAAQAGVVYLPTAVMLPAVVYPFTQSVLILLLPALAAMYAASSRYWMRVGIVVASAGMALVFAPAQAIATLTQSTWPHALGSLGLLLTLCGLLIYRIELAFSRQLVGAAGAHLAASSRPSAPAFAARILARPRQFLRHAAHASYSHNLLTAYAGASAALWAAAMLWYAFGSFHLLQVTLLAFSIVSALLAASRQTPAVNMRPAHLHELRCVAGIMLLLSPLYLLGLYWIPLQINTDELIFMHHSRYLIENMLLDLFALHPHYFHFPSGSFIVIGVLAKMLGGVTLENVRFVNGVFGLLCIPAAYLLCRQFWPRKLALTTTLILGASHTLIGLSRMAIRDNLPLLLELLALALLFNGWKTKSRARLILGGAIAGLGLYNYFSARAIMVIWTAFVGVLALREMHPSWRANFKPALSRATFIMLFTLIGFLLTAGPMLISTHRLPKVGMDYPKKQIVIYPQGRALLREWESTDDTWAALKQNMWRGFTIFNNNVADRSHIYENEGNGFVDPLTGLLLWLGVTRIAFARRRRAHHWLMLSGLLVIWIPMSLLMTKNPAYSRMLVVLPFVLLLAIEGARLAAFLLARLNRTLGRYPLRRSLFRGAAIAVVLWNLRIFHEHHEWARRNGHAVGDTLRYVERKRDDPSRAFYVVMGEEYPYFNFGKDMWADWVRFYAPPPRRVALLRPKEILTGEQPRDLVLPASVFVSNEMWEAASEKFLARYPRLTVKKITANGKQLVLEIPER
ncbi:MAG TPA: glycosyltransferase family 87 protein [Planctomycetota bacterium]|nr:glycosyltransferase family 87 protein [Planctomycetota bacterium]